MNFALPRVQGVMRRRFLVNYRVKPKVVSRLLPAPLRPKIVHGWAMAGICLIELEQLRPAGLAGFPGLRSRNAAHRVAVEWEEKDEQREGVFVPRRDTDSRFNELLGGWLFPGVHHAAEFNYWESGERFKIELNSRDGETRVRLAARRADGWAGGSVFGSLAEASAFYRGGSRGWSPARNNGHCEGLELLVRDWRVEPLIVERVESSWFENTALFPAGSVEFDCALLMRDIPHEWQAMKTHLKPASPRHNRHGVAALFELP